MALFVLAGCIAVVAVADHRHKSSRMGPASVASWYCEHRGQRCEEPQAEAIEASWQRREQVYRVGFWAVSVGGVAALGFRLRPRMR